MRWLFWCSTADEWVNIIRSRTEELEDTRPQMTLLLVAIRQDVDRQFDEYQGKWRPLRPYTLTKKEAMNADMRILHETHEGQGLRLRDAYKQAGYVTDDGTLEYTYPVEKPYAREHQEGAVVDVPEGMKGREGSINRTGRGRAMEKQFLDKFDNEYFERFFKD